MTVTGQILRIEKTSSFDGEGLRTVVFLKGCPLRCTWCSTPESQSFNTEFGVARNKCTGCFACVDVCPEKAISWDMKSEQFSTDATRCTDCRKCIRACPTDARQAWGYTATVEDIYKEVEKDSLFYFHSGGGITLSGGECLAQPDFSAALLERCMSHGINTAIETSGAVPWKNIDMVLPYTDTLFYDLKHMDDAAHRELTGSGNRRVMENIERIDTCHHAVSLIIRVPLIPGINDQKQNLEATAEFCKSLGKLTEIQMLPYHRLGIETYNRMSKFYPLNGLEIPTQECMKVSAAILKSTGLTVSIGG